MNNQQAIDRLVKHLEWGWSEETVAAIETGIHALKETQWIPVSERLPKNPEIDGDSDGYIVQTRRVAQPFIGYWDGREWTDEEVDVVDEVIAWMPLPQPYREGE